MAPSSLGLRGARDILKGGSRLAIAAQRGPTTAYILQNVRHASSRAAQNRAPAPKVSEAAQMSRGQITVDSVRMMVPGTFVPLPLSQYPRSPRKFFQYGWEYLKAYYKGLGAAIGMVISSKPKILARARYRLNNAAFKPVAKAMHRELAEALAAGNSSAVHRLTVSQLGTQLAMGIEARPAGRRYTWELVKYNGQPKITGQVMTSLSMDRSAPILRQVVVRISSRQRKAVYAKAPKSDEWSVVPGSEKEVDLVENVMFVSLVDPVTWTQGDWRILGSIPSTRMKEWLQEKRDVETLERADMESRMKQ